MSHDDGLDALSSALTAAGMKHVLYHDCIHIELRGRGGHLEIKAWAGGSRSASLTLSGECVELTSSEAELLGTPEQVAALVARELSERGLVAQAIPGAAA